MTTYFFITLFISLGLLLGLFLLLRRSLQVNWTMRNKKAFSFLLPVLLSAILTAFVIIDTFPRLLDTVNFFQNNLKTIDVSSDEISVKNHRYLINGQTYITGFKNEIVEEGANYTIYYLPNTKVIIRREKVEILPGSGPIIEEIPISD